MALPTRQEDWRELAAGCGFTEGPVASGDNVRFVSINRGLVYTAPLDGSGASQFAETGGGPNGVALDAADRLWIAQNGGRVMDSKSFPVAAGVQRVADGAAATVSAVSTSADPADPDDVDGFDAPNDCAFGPDGRLYITDPHGRLGDSRGDGPTGRIWALDPTDGSCEIIAEGLRHPNGLCFTADGSELWVSDTKTGDIMSFTRTEQSGGHWPSRVVDTVPQGGPDGIALDTAGNLWAAATAAEGIAVRSADGTWDFIDLGKSFPTNVAFVGPELSTVVVTAARGGRLLAADVETPGLPLHVPEITLD